MSYAVDGSVKVTQTDPTSFNGAIAKDGSMNVTVVNGVQSPLFLPPTGYFNKPGIEVDRTNNNVSIAAQRYYYAGLWQCPRDMNITKIHGGFNTGVATSTLRVGIYEVDMSPGVFAPTTLVVDGGTPISGAAAGPFTVTVDVNLTAGKWYCDALLAKTANPDMALQYSHSHNIRVVDGAGDFTGCTRWMSDASTYDNASTMEATAPALSTTFGAGANWYNFFQFDYTWL